MVHTEKNAVQSCGKIAFRSAFQNENNDVHHYNIILTLVKNIMLRLSFL